MKRYFEEYERWMLAKEKAGRRRDRGFARRSGLRWRNCAVRCGGVSRLCRGDFRAEPDGGGGGEGGR